MDNSTNNVTDKLTDKAFSRFMLTAILSIVVCLVCLCSATWAWYNMNSSSTDNELSSGKFNLEVAANDETTASVMTFEQLDGSILCPLPSPGVYTVTLKRTEDSTVKGFCVITVNGIEYSTSSINENNPTLTFTLKADTPNLAVKFTPAWGSPSNPTVRANELFIPGQ